MSVRSLAVKRVAIVFACLLIALPAYAAAPTASFVSISGTPEVGLQLSGNYFYFDVDGDPEGVSTFRWLRNGTAIPGATAQNYTLVAADQGALIIFEVTPVAATHNGDGLLVGAAVQSAAVGPVAPANTAPTANGVTISGTTEAGFTLTGNYTYQDADSDPEGSSTFRWLRNNVAIPGATSETYLLVAADVGTLIVFEVTPVAQSGVTTGTPVRSGSVGPISPANTAPTAINVTASGTPEAGFTLSGDYTYQDADGDPEGTSTFRWLRNGSPIPGATSEDYLLAAADVGTMVSFQVTPVAQSGVITGAAVASPALGPILAANTAPTATNVLIGGTPSIGETLTGSYNYADADGDTESGTTFRWLRNGGAIAGETSTTYLVALADVGTTLQFEVTPAAATGVSPGAPAVSGGVAVANTPPVITGQVTLSTPEETALEIVLAHLTVEDPDSAFPGAFTLAVANGINYSRAANTITPATDFNGDLTIPVTVNDGSTDSPVFNLSVSVTPVNDQPRITGQSLLSTMEDSSITVVINDVIVTDPDSAGFTLALQAGADYTLAGNVVTPTANFNGNLTIPATVTDDSGEANATSMAENLTIEVTAVNDVPVVMTPIDDQNAVEGSAFDLDISANFADADLDTLTFSVDPAELPISGNLVFDGATGVFSGTPVLEDTRDNDPYIVNVTATDSQPGTIPAVDQFNLNISALDRANVTLDISVTPDPALQNDELQWTFETRNPVGPQAAAAVELNGSFIGSGLTVTSAATCTIQPPAGQVTNFNCTVGGLAPGGVTSVVLTTATTEVGDVTAFAVSAGTAPVPIDPNLDDNSAQTAVGVAQVFSNGAVQTLGNSNVLSVAAGDVNGDGAADLVAGTAAGQPVQIFLSDGFRDFAASPIMLADNSANKGVALADFDGNGTLDLVVANADGQIDMVYSNDGAANFTAMAALDATFSQDVAVADFNNDGFIDIVVAAAQGNPAYRGDGTGGFVLEGMLGDSDSRGVAVGRFDNDMNDDVVFANSGSASRVWVFDSASSSFASRALLNIGDTVAVSVGSFGGDATNDLAFARIPTAIGDVPANPVLINNGDGTFPAPANLLGGAPTFDILTGNVNDEDGAGLDDLVFVNSSGVHQIWVADGSGGFDLHSEQIADRDSLAGVVTELGMTDVGDPGGLDLAMAGAIQSGVGVFLNDGSGNLGRGDAVPPVLTLVGESTVSIPSGSVYSDAGATAEDNIDGVITAQIAATSTVNTTVVGSYTVTYNVSDFAGNPATAISRTVTVTPASGTGGGGGGRIGLVDLVALILLLWFIQSCRISRNQPVRVRTSRCAKRKK